MDESNSQQLNYRLNVQSGGCIAGVETDAGSVTGTLTDAVVIYQEGAGNQDALNIARDDSYVKANSGGIEQVNITGTTTIVCDNGSFIGSVAAAEGFQSV